MLQLDSGDARALAALKGCSGADGGVGGGGGGGERLEGGEQNERVGKGEGCGLR